MDPIEGEFICRKCQTPLSINKILVSKKGFAIFEVRCQKKHTGKRKLNMAQQNEWMPTVIKHLYLCPRCNSNLTDIKQKTEGDRTILVLNCPTHGKIKKVISTSFWYAMDALRKQISARPAYPAGYPGPYGQQYPPGAYPSPYPQPGYPPQQTPGTPFAPPPGTIPNTPPGTYPPASPPPETISPPALEVTPPSNAPPSSAQSNRIELPSSGDSLGAGDICPACGEPISPGAKFCTNCGTEL
ncbi:MAG: zinc-ribbon domain-containing protein [Candidatus Helarchaeota archaeon]